MKASPKKVFLTTIFYIERIDTILNPYFIAPEQFSMIGKRSLRFICRSHTNPAGPLSTPNRHGVIHHIPITDFVYIRCPKISFRLKCRAGFIGKSSTHKAPVYHIFRSVNRKISDIFRCVQVIITIICLDNRRVGKTVINNGVGILLCNGRNTERKNSKKGK